MVFLGGSGRLLTTGFSRHSDRQYAIWSQHDLTAPLTCETIDSSSGVVFPYYDNDTNMVYLAGKVIIHILYVLWFLFLELCVLLQGDGNIRYYEVVNEAPWMHYLSQFISGNPQRGLGVMPKRGVNTSICEVFRFYKLHATRGMCEPISMIVPRKVGSSIINFVDTTKVSFLKFFFLRYMYLELIFKTMYIQSRKSNLLSIMENIYLFCNLSRFYFANELQIYDSFSTKG